MTMPMKNIIAAIFLALIAAGYGLLASELPDRAAISVPGPAFFPKLISGFILFLCAALLYSGVSGLRHERPFANGLSFPAKAVGLLVWFAAFITLLPYLGFLIAGVPFFAGLMLLCNSRRLLTVVIGAAVIPTFLFYLFRDGFLILLPHAQWM